METHEYEAPLDVPAEQVFEEVRESDLALPGFSAGSARADAAGRAVRWGAGELTVHEDGPDRSRIRVRIELDGADRDEVQQRLAEAVAVVAQRAAARADGIRADSQEGWSG